MPQSDAGLPEGRFYFQIIDDTLAVVDLVTSELCLLNQAAGALWLELYATPVARGELEASWARRFGLTPAAARADIEACIAEWQARGWIDHAAGERIWVSAAAPDPSPIRAIRVEPPTTGDVLSHRRLDLPGRPVDISFAATPGAGQPSLMARGIGLLSGVPERAATDETEPTRVTLLSDGIHHYVGVDGAWNTTDDSADALGLAIRSVFRSAYPDDDIIATLHAAALERGGAITILPGVSGAGKSTLTAFLVAHGWAYIGDDFLALASGTGHSEPRLLPLPNAISIKDGSVPILERFHPALRDLPRVSYGAKSARYLPIDRSRRFSGTATIERLVFPRYVQGSSAKFEPISTSAALLGLIEAGMTTMGVTRGDHFAMLFAWLERIAKFTLTYGSLEEAQRCLEATNSQKGASAP